MTDRRRLDVIGQVAAAAAAGIDLVQVRERDLEAAELAGLVTRAVMLTRGTTTRIVVNDRLDVALACGADGVHLPADSLPTSAARSLAPPGFLVGRSIHSVEEAASAGAVDYLIAGTVFRTASKPHAERLLGLDGLRSIVAASRAPVLAIGGVTMDRLGDIAATGAAGVAAISLFGESAGLATTAHAIRPWFDRVKTPS
ncbi:MAG TPA: thiamine phosphate synthase [Vicinamibacterales bacterium]